MIFGRAQPLAAKIGVLLMAGLLTKVALDDVLPGAPQASPPSCLLIDAPQQGGDETFFVNCGGFF